MERWPVKEHKFDEGQPSSRGPSCFSIKGYKSCDKEFRAATKVQTNSGKIKTKNFSSRPSLSVNRFGLLPGLFAPNPYLLLTVGQSLKRDKFAWRIDKLNWWNKLEDCERLSSFSESHWKATGCCFACRGCRRSAWWEIPKWQTRHMLIVNKDRLVNDYAG